MKDTAIKNYSEHNAHKHHWWRETIEDALRDPIPFINKACPEFVVFNPPGGGHYQVRNEQIRLEKFRKEMLAALHSPRKVYPRKRAMHGTIQTADRLIKEFFEEDNPRNAAQMVVLWNRPMTFGTGREINPYTHPYRLTKNDAPCAAAAELYAARCPTEKTWLVVEASTGLACNSYKFSNAEEAIMSVKDIPLEKVQKAILKNERPGQHALAETWFNSMGVEDFDYESWRSNWDLKYVQSKKDIP